MLAYGWQLGVLSTSGVVLAAALLALALAPAFRLPDIDDRFEDTPSGANVAGRLEHVAIILIRAIALARISHRVVSLAYLLFSSVGFELV